MRSSGDSAERQRRSWAANAVAWTEAVRTQRIESRRVATDAAVLQAVATRSPARVLDLGCGEGWLCRALAQQGIEVVGVDASEHLIQAARAQDDQGHYHVLSFEEVSAEAGQLGKGFDLIVFNFSLLDEEISEILSSAASLLSPGGVLVIQTVHPWSACGAEPYRSGWRTESFQSFGSRFPEPMPWYFRTLSDWTQVLHQADLQLHELHEPSHPETHQPLSLLLLIKLRQPHSA